MDAKRARELLDQVKLFDGEALPGVRWPATDAAVSWLAQQLREALATIIAREEPEVQATIADALRRARTEHDNADGPCACGAWHRPGEEG